MSEGKTEIKNIYVDIWPDWVTLALGIVIVIGVFYFTGLEIKFVDNNEPGVYMEFDIE